MRAPLDPAAGVDLYLAYGRYEEIIARNGPEIFRVVVSPIYEDQRLSALRTRLTPQQVQLNEYADFFAKTSSVYTGIIGVIVGYYFGRPTRMQGQAPDGPVAPAEKE